MTAMGRLETADHDCLIPANHGHARRFPIAVVVRPHRLHTDRQVLHSFMEPGDDGAL